MPVSAIRVQVTANAQAAAALKPKCHATQADSSPVVSSTKGYRSEILALQAAQRPRRMSQLITGMFCHALIGALQCGQAERGVLKLKRSSNAAVIVVAELSTAGNSSLAWACHSRSQ